MVKKRSSFSLSLDRKKRSKQPWERGRGAPKKGNPRYKPVKKRTRTGLRKVYILRKTSKKHSRKHSRKH